MKQLLFLLIAASVLGCDLISPDSREEQAFLGDGGVPIYFVVPDTVLSGADFEVQFQYHGSGSCTQAIETRSRIQGTLATLDPRVEVMNGPCTADLRTFLATDTLRFVSSGPATVRLMGTFHQRDTVVVRSTFVR
jgi:hypothetical protein